MADKRSQNAFRGRPGRRGAEAPVKEFEEKVIDINRVTRVVKGGKRLRFRVLVVIGDRANHRVAYGIGKAGDVTAAVAKAVADAKKGVHQIFLNDNNTLPYQVNVFHKSAHVLIKPAPVGTGLIAGGPLRVVLQLAGVQDAVAKILGSSNKISNVAAAVNALADIRSPREILRQRGVSPKTKKTESKEKEIKE